MEHPDSEVFLKAARHVQLEPVWGGTEDSAAPLRAAALVALARVEGTGSLPMLVDALADPARDVRIAAAVALGAVGSEGAGLVLRLKVRLGDDDPDVFSECLGGLLAVDADREPAARGRIPRSRRRHRLRGGGHGAGQVHGWPEALDPLADCWRRSHSSELKRQLLLAIAILRRPAALDFLAGLVASGPEPDAVAALSALGIYKDDPRLRERIAGLVREAESPTLQAAFNRGFGPGGP